MTTDRTVLAALDASPAARPVLETARRVAELMGADVFARAGDTGALNVVLTRT